jgi:chromosome segregation ATPase
MIRGGERPTIGYHRRTMGWQGEIRDVITQLEQQCSRLEEVRERARRQGGPEGERLEAQATTRLRDIEQRIADLRPSLE